MKRLLPFLVVLALVSAVGLSATAADETTETTVQAPAQAVVAPAAPQTDAQLFTLDAPQQDQVGESCDPGEEGALELAVIPPPWCPYGAPRCFNDDNCDAYCGDPRFGYCFSNGCCGCSG